MSEEIFALVTGIVALVGTLFVASASIYVALKVTGWVHQQRVSQQHDMDR